MTRPMRAMSVDYHLSTGLKKHGFMKMSDKLREQLVEQGYDETNATTEAPTMLKGLVMTREGKLDISRMRYELDAAQPKRNPDTDPFGFGFPKLR